ncbi:MAG: glycosyltransferase family 39 protein [bacterium]|nr:glycosyltransferase family 39 protein [bacterium]
MALPSLYKTALLIFFLALVLRVALLPFSLFDDRPFIGATVAGDGYNEIAINIMEGHGFTRSLAPPYVPDSVRTPLYSLFIAGILSIFGSYKALLIIQVLLGSVSAVIAWLIAREFLGARLSAMVGILTALEPYTAYLTGKILTETTFIVFFLLSIYLFLQYLKNRNLYILALTSALFGIATLIKPTTQYAPLFLLTLALWNSGFNFKKLFMKEAPIVLGIFLLLLSPWMYRNYTVFGNASLNVEPASALFAMLVPSTIALEKGISWESAASQFYKEQGVHDIDDVNLGNTDEFTQRAIAELRHHPKGLAKSIVTTMYAFFTHDGYAGLLNTRFHVGIPYAHPPVLELMMHPSEAILFFGNLMQGPGAIVILGRLFWIAVTLLGLAGAFLYWASKGLTPQFLFVTGITVYFALTTIIVGLGADVRYRVPVEPFLFILAAFALEYIFRKRTKSLMPATTEV